MLYSLLSTSAKKEVEDHLNKELSHLSTTLEDLDRLNSCLGMSSHSVETSNIMTLIVETSQRLLSLSAGLVGTLAKQTTSCLTLTQDECDELINQGTMTRRSEE